MQATADASQSTAAKSPATTDKEKAAAELINRYTAWAAAAGVIPVPFVDALAVGGVQLKMLRELAAIFEVEFSENRGKSIIAALAGALGSAGAAPVATSALKLIPGIGTAIGSISMPALSAAATYAVGRVFVQHFLSGGTLLDLNPQDYRDYLRDQAKTKTSKDAPATVSPASSSTRGSAKAAN